MGERSVGLGEIAQIFLKIGTMSYGGPAITGIMQTEIQEKRRWIEKPQFVEGLALVNMLPGPGATQLGIYLGYTKAGLAGGVVAGLCFILPAFLIMFALATAYVAFGALPSARNAFYGIGPVVVGIFAVSVYRLGKGTIKGIAQIVIALAAAAVMLLTPVGIILPLLAAGAVGIALFHSRRIGIIALGALAVVFGLYYGSGILLAKWATSVPDVTPRSSATPPGLWELGIFFFKVGAFTFGGGLSMLAFIQEQVVNQFGWFTSGVHRRSGVRPTYARPCPDACGVYWIQARWRIGWPTEQGQGCGSRQGARAVGDGGVALAYARVNACVACRGISSFMRVPVAECSRVHVPAA
jgi:chromate transporter